MACRTLKSLLNIVAIVGVAIISYQWGSSNGPAKSQTSELSDNDTGATPKIVLHYFDGRWTTETIRLLLKYGGIEFEDNRIKSDDWPNLKPTMPFGHLPVLEVDNKKGAQSIAIARYVAKMVKLTGANAWEDLEIDAIVDTLSEIKDKLYKIFGEDNAEAKAKLKEIHLKDTIPYYFEKLERQAKKNNGHLVGQKLTWADFYFTTACDIYRTILETDTIENYPNLVKVRENVINIPAVKSWMEIRPHSDF